MRCAGGPLGRCGNYGTNRTALLWNGRKPSRGQAAFLGAGASLLPAEAAQLVRNESAADIWALGYHGTDGKRAICKEALYGDAQ